MSPLVRMVRAVNRMWTAYRLGGKLEMSAEDRAEVEKLMRKYPRYARLIKIMMPGYHRF